MDAFEILGIASTKDIKEIRKAYSKLMTKFSPEKDPEGFQKLRSAYEEAISKARIQEETQKKALSPIDEFMEAFEANYRCFEKRLQASCWEELLEKDICYNIDSSKQVNYRVLNFIKDDYNFPNHIWILFNNYFSWTAKKDSLYNSFNKNFIDFVIYRIKSKSTFDYEYLKQCEENQQDKFIHEYRNFSSAIDQFDLYTADNTMKAAQKICPDHPNLLILIGKYYSISGRINDAFELFTTLIDNNKENVDAFFYRAELFNTTGQLNKAYEDYKAVLKLSPSSVGAWYSMARCCLCLKKYEEAIEYSSKLNESTQYRQDISVILSSSYSYYIDCLLEKMELHSMDDKLKFKLADAYYKTSRIEESYNILKELMESPNCDSKSYYLFCRVLIAQKNIDLAYSNVCKAVDLYNEDFELNFLKADILDDLGEYEESILQYDKVLLINKNESAIYNNKAYELNKINRYNEALECANKSIELDPGLANGYKNKAGALLGLELYEDCLEACEEALDKYQYLTDVYIIKIRAFIDMNLLEEALGVYNKASDWGLKDSNLYYQKSRILMFSKKYKEAIEYCDLALELDENNGDFYYLKGLCCYYDDKDSEAIEWFDQAIKYGNANGAAYFYKIKCLLNISKEKEALEVTNHVIDLKLNHLDKFHNLKGFMLEGMKKYEDSIVEYKKAIEYEPVPNYYYSIGHAYNELEMYSNAIEYYGKFAKLEPNEVEVHVNMSYSLYNLGEYNECIKCCDDAIRINPKYVIAHQNKGWALFKLNYIEEAAAECNIALKLDGNNEDVLLLKLRILKLKGLNQDALVVCDRMLELNENNNTVKNILKEIQNINKNEKRGILKYLFK